MWVRTLLDSPACAPHVSRRGNWKTDPEWLEQWSVSPGETGGSEWRCPSVLHAFNHLESTPRRLATQRVMQEEIGCKKELPVPPPMSPNCSPNGQSFDCDKSQRTSPVLDPEWPLPSLTAVCSLGWFLPLDPRTGNGWWSPTSWGCSQPSYLLLCLDLPLDSNLHNQLPTRHLHLDF